MNFRGLGKRRQRKMGVRVNRSAVLLLSFVAFVAACLIWTPRANAQRRIGPPVRVQVYQAADTFEQEEHKSVVKWSPDKKELTMCIVVPAYDPNGVRIDGVREGDMVRITKAEGVASFAGRTWKHDAVDLGLDIGKEACLSWEPCVKLYKKAKDDLCKKYPKVCEEVNKEVKKKLKGRRKFRDAYGVDLNDEYKRGEGGVIVCMPSAGGPLHRGSYEPGKSYKINGKGPRRDFTLSADLQGNAFFLVEGNLTHNTRQADKDGSIYILAWDKHNTHQKDNRGFYMVCAHLRRGP